MGSVFKMSCRWCGLIFKHDCLVGYCSEKCKQEAKAYHSELRDEGYMVTVKEACQIHREEEGILPHEADEPDRIGGNLILAPFKVTAAATQWRYVPARMVDYGVRIIKGGRK